MSVYNKIAITLNAEISLWNNCILGLKIKRLSDNFESTFYFYEIVVPTKIASSQVELPSQFTAIVGQASAQKYYEALQQDFSVIVFDNQNFNFQYQINDATVTAIVFDVEGYDISFIEDNFTIPFPQATFLIQNNVTFNPNTIDENLEHITLSPLEIQNIQIEIVDTTNNLSILQEELSQISSSKISWDEGDDIFEAIKSSKLVFNMLNEEGIDAKFLELFTGNESRYNVKLNTVNPLNSLDKKLIWQGFLLPDMYSEPYINGVSFIEFEATDKLGTLKGKYLEKWFYNKNMPIGLFLAMVLKQTGLHQDILIYPSIYPASYGTSWLDMSIPMSQYIDNDKITNCYDLLVDFLEANFLTIKNYRGFWIIKGVNRKKDLINAYGFRLNTSGILVGYVTLVNRVAQPLISNGTASIKAISPYSTVSIDFEKEGEINLFEKSDYTLDDFFNLKYPNIIWKQWISLDPEIFESNLRQFYQNYIKPWKVVNLFYWKVSFYKTVSMFQNFGNDLNLGSLLNMTCSEQSALTKYVELDKQIEISANTKYTFSYKYSMKTSGYDATYPNDYPVGLIRRYFAFQILVNDVEVYSNRPGFVDNDLFVYKTSQITNGGAHDWDIEVQKVDLFFKIGGKLKFRILHPIQPTSYNSNHLENGLPYAFYGIENLSLERVNKKYLKTVAKRNVDYTTTFKRALKFTSINDTSFKNNIALQKCQNIDDYVFQINTDANEFTSEVKKQYVKPYGLQEINIKKKQITQQDFLMLFSENYINSCYFQTPLKKEFFNSFLSSFNYEGNLLEVPHYYSQNIQYFLAIVWQAQEYAVLPENFTLKNIDFNESLFYVKFNYEQEIILNRAKWTYHNSDKIDEFQKIIARMIFQLRSKIALNFNFESLELLLPDVIVQHEYNDENIMYYPTSLTLNLSEGKTTCNAVQLTDNETIEITYE